MVLRKAVLRALIRCAQPFSGVGAGGRGARAHLLGLLEASTGPCGKRCSIGTQVLNQQAETGQDGSIG